MESFSASGSGDLLRMCGRYQRRSDKRRIAEAFALGDGASATVDYYEVPLLKEARKFNVTDTA
jgi:hypothetical protein